MNTLLRRQGTVVLLLGPLTGLIVDRSGHARPLVRTRDGGARWPDADRVRILER